jgi:putative ABC transport system permease protein
MITNYIKTALRNFYRNKSITFIKILGLALGLAVTFFILIYVSTETSYNDFNTQKENIYRIILKDNTHNWHIKTTSYPIAENLKENYPEVTKATRIIKISKTIIRKDKELFKADNFICVDSDFFEIFSTKKLNGSFIDFEKEALSIAISESAAKKYFGNIDIINKSIPVSCYGTEYILTIKSVYKDFPINSTIRPDFIASIELGMKQAPKMMVWTDGIERDEMFFKNSWDTEFLETYILLENKVEIKDFESRINNLIIQNLKEDSKKEYYLQNIGDIYLKSEHIFGDNIKGNMNSIFIFSIIAFLVLLIACINYIILSTSQIVSRKKEFGIRKIVGGKRIDLFRQITIESLLIVFITIPLSFILIEQFRPFLIQILEKQIMFVYNWKFVLGFIFIVCFVVFIPGFYIIYFLNRISPISILRKNNDSFVSKFSFRKLLIIFQFVIFMVLVVFSLGIRKQINYSTKQDLGFNPENKVVLNIGSQVKAGNYETIKKELLKNPEIISISGAMWLPPSNGRMSVSITDTSFGDEPLKMEAIFVDQDFIETFGLQITKGKSFADIEIKPEWKIIVNETAEKLINSDEIIGRKIWNSDIIGVVKDFKFHSFHEQIKPTMLIVGENMIREMVIHYINKTDKVVLDKLKIQLNNLMPENDAELQNLKDRFTVLYKEEYKLVSLISIFSFLAIFIASIGLLGLTIFTAKKHTKNIAIRKVNGASIINILNLLLSSHVKLLIVSFLISIPVSIYLLNKWLQNFAYKTSITWEIFVISGLLALFITLFTISWYSIKAARKNPVDSLRYE